MQYMLLYAHIFNSLHKEDTKDKATKEEIENDWNKRLEDAKVRSIKRQKSREDMIKEAQDKIMKHIEENK